MAYRIEDFAKWVSKANISDAKKTVSMNWINACRDLETKTGELTQHDMVDLMVSQGSMLFEMYLNPVIDEESINKVIARCIAEHKRECMGSDLPNDKGAFAKKMLLGSMKNMGFGGPLVIFMIVYYKQIVDILGNIAK